MRRTLALAVAAVMMTGIAVAPASAVTKSKAGTKCGVHLALAKQGSAKFYCGQNRNTKTRKAHKLAWIRSVVCFNGIVEYRKTAAQYKAAQVQFNAMQTTYSSIDTKTMDAATTISMQSIGSSLGNLKTMLDMLGPVSTQLGQNISSLCV